MHEGNPRKLVQMTSRAGEDEPRRNGHRVFTPARTLRVDESRQVRTARNPVHKLPQSAFLEPPQAVAGRTAEPLGEGDARHADSCRLSCPVETILLQDWRLAQLDHL